MSVTKKPKRVNVIYRQFTTESSEYSCPSCHTTFIGAGVRRNTLRFRCDCGQELIVDKPRPDAGKGEK